MCKEHGIIENAMMMEDRSFGKAGGARGVLNLDGVPWLDRGLPHASLLLADLRAACDHFAEECGSPAVLLEQSSGRSTHQAHRAQHGESFAAHCPMLVARGRHGAHGCQAVVVADLCHEEQRLHIPLLEGVLHFLRP